VEDCTECLQLTMMLANSIVAILPAKELVVADNPKKTSDGALIKIPDYHPFLVRESCEGVYNKNPETQTDPGYYWILSYNTVE